MAVYKIPQDVEADDKFVGPLSFKQFIYAGIAAVSAYLSFLSLTKGFWPALILLMPLITVAGFLGFPWARDQPTEIWLAARIRFFLKPRVRIWNQSGIKELVTITAPKHVERHYTNGLSQNEVSSRLTGLADLLDSRGWAVKNVNVNLYSNPVSSTVDLDNSDRLIDVTNIPQEVADVTANDDILNESTNPTAQHFEQMIKSSEERHRQGVIEQLQTARAETAEPAQNDLPSTKQKGADFWFLQQGGHDKQHQQAEHVLETAITAQQAAPEQGFTTFQAPSMVAPHTAAPIPTTEETAYASQAVKPQDEEAFLKKVHHDHENNGNPFGHIKTIMPLGQDPAATPATAQPVNDPAYAQTPPAIMPTTAVTPPVDPAIMNLASNDDLNVATLARQAEKANNQRLSDDEVVVSLR